MKTFRKAAVLCIAVLLIAGLTAGCGNKKKERSSVSYSDDSVVMQIGDTNVRKDEVMAYAYFMAHKYSILGGGIWSYDTGDGSTAGKDAVSEIADTVTYVKVINAEAAKEKVSLNADETDEVQRKTSEYLNSISRKDKEKYMLGRQKIGRIFEENAIAGKMYYMNIDDAEPVSDDDARQADFKYIKLPSDDETEQLYGKTPEDIRDIAASSEDFEETAGKYTTASETSVTLGKDSDEFSSGITEEIMKLHKGEVSGLLEDGEEHYIFYCTSRNDRDATDKKKEELTVNNQKKAFAEHYSKWIKGTDLTMNESFWNGLDLSGFD